ncbi:MAG: metal-dependent hydrolase [Acidovorax sp.]|nr:metal-dependent hydrolase [Acidovorax sp.]
MDPVTHVATGVILSQLLPTPSRVWGAVAGAVFALLPDLDYLLMAVDRLAFLRHHRGFTHSLIAIPLFALLGTGVGRALAGPRWFRPLFFLGLAVLVSHLILDLATPFGTQIFSPFTRRKVALDWLFIIDPYLTFLLAAGAGAALFFPSWGRQAGAFFLTAGAAYILLCGVYHHRALALAHQVFPEKPGEVTVAALPQPFSCRRWHLIGAGPERISQAFIQLPYLACLGRGAAVKITEATTINCNQDCRVPPVPYQPPQDLTVQTWTGAWPAPREFPPEARRILDIYLEFARFPLLFRAQYLGEEQLVEWLDLRFSVPGRTFPFVLQFHLDSQGRLQKWLLGRRQGEEP